MGEEMSEHLCWGCQKFEATNLPGFIQADCMSCLARDIAMGPAAARREADPSELQAEIRRTWTNQEDYRKGRSLVWEWLKKLSTKEMTT